MDRAYLKYLLNAGPSRVLDVRKICMEEERDPLFKTSVLNACILLKQAPDSDENERLPRIATKIYMPYDRQRPEDGGESFFYSPKTIRNNITARIENKNINLDYLASDIELLNLFNDIPSFSPFLMKDILERAKVRIPDGYFVIPEQESAVIKQRMRARLRPLVASAFAGSTKEASAFTENAIERLAVKLWELDDMSELMPLIGAFRIEPEEAPKLFYCWLGISFFENEYLNLQPRLQEFARWIATNAQPREALPKDLLAVHKEAIAVVKRQLQSQWKRSLAILQEYASSYDELVSEKGSALRFIKFLGNSSAHFWALGGCLGRLEQSVETWEKIMRRYNHERLTFDAITTLFDLLNQINSGTTIPATAAPLPASA